MTLAMTLVLSNAQQIVPHTAAVVVTLCVEVIVAAVA